MVYCSLAQIQRRDASGPLPDGLEDEPRRQYLRFSSPFLHCRGLSPALAKFRPNQHERRVASSSIRRVVRGHLLLTSPDPIARRPLPLVIDAVFERTPHERHTLTVKNHRKFDQSSL